MSAGCFPVQRLQRFSTYGHLKQVVLRMIVEEISGEPGTKGAVKDLKVGAVGVGVRVGGSG